jgi:hypothetical protein
VTEEPLTDHPFLKELARIMAGVMKETIEHRERKIVQLREFLPHEKYTERVLFAAAEVQTTLTQLVQTVLFMSNFRSTQKLKAYRVGRYDHSVYHYENFLIRVTGCLDRCLILTNSAFDLGNEPEDCKYQLIKKNRYIKESEVLGPLGNINEIIKPYRKQRNIVTHSKRYSEANLRTLELFSLMQNIEPDVVPSHLAKLEADQVVAIRKED